MYIVDIISMDEKATQLQRASFDLFLKKKIVVALVSLIDKFLIF